jgi:hypothetical protein
VVQALRLQGVGERFDDMLLPHHFGKFSGTVFTGEHKVGHGVTF